MDPIKGGTPLGVFFPPRYARLIGSANQRRKKWWSETGLNRRHMDFQSIALPAELPDHWIDIQERQGYQAAINPVKYRFQALQKRPKTLEKS